MQPLLPADTASYSATGNSSSTSSGVRDRGSFNSDDELRLTGDDNGDEQSHLLDHEHDGAHLGPTRSEAKLWVSADRSSSPEDVETTAFVWKLTIFAALGGFLFGFDTGVISGALLLIKDDFDLSSFEQELVVSVATAGAMGGALCGSFTMDRWGRKSAIMVSAFIFVVGALVLALAPDLDVLLGGRVVVGFAIGLSSMSVPAYVAEAAPPEHRGRLVSMVVLFITGGQLVSYLVDSAFADVHEGWRYMLGLSGVPAIVQLVGMNLMPRSPRFLLSVGQKSRAREVLALILAAPSNSAEVQLELDAIQSDIRRSQAGTWHELLTSPRLRRPLFLAMTLQAIQQFCGINTAMYYSATIIKMAGISSNRTAILFSDAVAFTNMVMTIVAMRLIDRMGRRKLLLISLAGLTLGLFFIGGSFVMITGFSVKQDECSDYTTCTSCIFDDSCGWCDAAGSNACFHGNKTGTYVNSSTCYQSKAHWDWDSGCDERDTVIGGYLAVASLVFYVAFFAVGMGVIPWTIQSEVFPLEVRGKASGLATASNWTANLIVSISFLSLADTVSQAITFWLIGGIGVLSAVFVYFKLPETRGKTLEEMEALFVR